MGFKFLSITFIGVAFLSLGLSVGCAKNNDTENKDPFPTYDANSPLGKELNAATLNCATSECESNKSDFESVGMVAMARDGYVSKYGSYKMGQCVLSHQTRESRVFTFGHNTHGNPASDFRS